MEHELHQLPQPCAVVASILLCSRLARCINSTSVADGYLTVRIRALAGSANIHEGHPRGIRGVQTPAMLLSFGTRISVCQQMAGVVERHRGCRRVPV